MMRDHIFRRVLWAATAFNVFGAFLLGFPESALGQFVGLPAPVPVAYRAIVAVFVLLFAGAYAWLATRPRPDRPMVAFAAIGKASVFVAVLALWLGSQASIRSLLAVSGDLAFAAVFAWWLFGTEQSI